MKQKFLELVKQVKETGIAEALLKSSNAEELKKAWKEFEENNKELFEKIRNWSVDYNKGNKDSLFAQNDEIENPIEIAVIIYIIGDEDTSELEIFSDYEKLTDAIAKIDGIFAQGLAKLAEEICICYITAEDIFDPESFDEEDEDESDDPDQDEEEEDSES